MACSGVIITLAAPAFQSAGSRAPAGPVGAAAINNQGMTRCHMFISSERAESRAQPNGEPDMPFSTMPSSAEKSHPRRGATPFLRRPGFSEPEALARDGATPSLTLRALSQSPFPAQERGCTILAGE